MENKELRNILVNNIKNELKDFAQIQKELKKSRKLEFRPKDKSLQSICDEIEKNRHKIIELLSYYLWIKHGLKYWNNRDVHDYWDYLCYFKNPTGHYPDSYRDKITWFTGKLTYNEYFKEKFYENISKLLEKYNMGLGHIDFINFLYTNK